MALIDLKSNLSNFRSDFSQESKLKSPSNTPGAIPADIQKKSPNNAPTQRYINDVKVEPKIQEKSSPVNIIKPIVSPKTSTIAPNIPVILDKISSINPLKLELKEKKSPINIPGTVNYFNDINSGAKGFQLNASDRNQSSFLGVKGQTYKHAVPGSGLANFTQAPNLKEKKSTINIPGTVNYFDDVKSGAKGFQLNASDRNQSSYLGIKGQIYNHAVPGSVIAKLGTVNYFDDVKSGAKGFQLNASDRNQSSFLGIKGTTYNHAVPGSILAKLSSVNYFDDVKSGATGFILNASDRNKSSYTGIKGTTYNHPKLPFTILQVGNASLDNQLPDGSIFRYLKSGASTTKKFSVKGYNDKNKYGSVVQSIGGQSNKSLLYTRSTEKNSPSALDAEYKKFNLRDDAYNPGYMKHPLVLRDIGKRWGSPFDDGLIRGGIVTAVERAALDTVRIAKWMASPKGLLWIVKQVGLGLTNAKVEAVGGAFSRQTRIHTGITSLLSVAGTAFGLHFTRHGLPFINEAASYENVVNVRNSTLLDNYHVSRNGSDVYSVGKGNRLIKLRKDLLPEVQPKKGERKEYGSPNDKKFGDFKLPSIPKLKLLADFKGAKIDVLSGLAGPGSVYGIGSTTIHRYVVSDEKAIAQAAKQNWHTRYTYNSQYATLGVVTDYRSSVGGPDSSNTTSRKTKDVDLSIGSLKNTTELFGTKHNGAPGSNNFARNLHAKLESSDGRAASFPDADKSGIKNYSTVAYHRLKRTTNKSFQDFRDDVYDQERDAHISYLGRRESDYYKSYNLRDKYGFGDVGQVNVDRSEPNKFLFKEDTFSGAADKRSTLSDNANFRGDKVNAYDIADTAAKNVYIKGGEDLIKFYFEDGVQGKHVMPFRCTMNGFTDNFSPGWDRIDIMGRPDGAYLYSSFERTVSFNFTVAAMSRSEMIPMWRKINYLASYTMPDLNGNSKPSGPMMRITIGNLFQQTPGFITSLSYTIPDDASWDIAEDNTAANRTPKQLPMIVDIAMTFQVIGDYRPEQMGRVYSLSTLGSDGNDEASGNWLGGRRTYDNKQAETQDAEAEKSEANKKE